jgi:hypothetical protein
MVDDDRSVPRQQHWKEPAMRSLLRRSLVVPILVVALVLAIALSATSALATNGGGMYQPPGGGVIKQVVPDLVVSSISHGYGRGGWYLDAVIRNQGDDHAGEFYVSMNGVYLYVPSLNAGASTLVRFHRGNVCEGRGTVMADAFNQVYELSEGNNSRDWVLIC